MLDSIDNILTQFEISHYGFLPVEEPLGHLPDQYYQPWETLIKQLPRLISDGTLYDEIARLPILATRHLRTIPEWRRAYVILAFLAHAHIWTANQPHEVRDLKGCHTQLILSEIAAKYHCTFAGCSRALRAASNGNISRSELVELRANRGGRRYHQSGKCCDAAYFHRYT